MTNFNPDKEKTILMKLKINFIESLYIFMPIYIHNVLDEIDISVLVLIKQNWLEDFNSFK